MKKKLKNGNNNQECAVCMYSMYRNILQNGTGGRRQWPFCLIAKVKNDSTSWQRVPLHLFVFQYSPLVSIHPSIHFLALSLPAWMLLEPIPAALG